MVENDMLLKIFKAQAELDAKIGYKLHTYNKQERVMALHLAIQQELSEVINCLQWKWWKVGGGSTPEELQMEVIDVLHFVVSMCQAVGLDAEKTSELYHKKNTINANRKGNGYGAG
jgi:dimeric dUTPase (all-alpha-NTP-PPase superfamily)